MKWIFEDGTVLDHRDLPIKVFEADGVTPVAKSSPMFGRELVFVLGPAQLARFDTRKDSEGKSEG